MAPERCQSGFKSGGRGSGSKEFRFFQANFRKILISSGNLKKCSFLGKNCPFTATSELIILFLFKSRHFRTYFLYTIRYNNISKGNHFRYQHSSNCESQRTYIAQDTSSRYIAQEYIFYQCLVFCCNGCILTEGRTDKNNPARTKPSRQKTPRQTPEQKPPRTNTYPL